MMIKINLLPVRQVKKREVGKQILVLYALVLIGAALGNYMWFSDLDSTVQRNQAQISATQRKITELQKVIGEVDNINKRKKELEDKIKVLADLRKGRAGPVKILDALATATPKKVWIREFDEKNGAVKLTGYAFSHEDVAEFMRGLGSLVWTPKGMGRLVEQKRDATTSRIELLDQSGTIEDFNVSEVGAFFTNIELKSATQTEKKTEAGAQKQVDFTLALNASYTL